VSFAASHPGSAPGQAVRVPTGDRQLDVRLFPQHCVAGTPGAAFAGARPSQPPASRLLLRSSAAASPVVARALLRRRRAAVDLPCAPLLPLPAEGLDTCHIHHTVHKGTHPQLEALSAFRDIAGEPATGEV
jgi:hypothetical protein